MDRFKGTLRSELVQKIAGVFGLRRLEWVRPGGGTASPKALFKCEQGVYLLKRRREEFCRENRIRFDHAFVQYLYERGLPVAPPLRTTEGRSWVVESGEVYEVVPFIEGLCQWAEKEGELISAGETLGRLHRESGSFSPPCSKDLGRDLYLPRYLHLLEQELETLSHETGERMLRMARRTIELSEEMEHEFRSPTVNHGDYTPANVLFRGSEVAGIFDFDWCVLTSPLWDMARAILFFAFRRKTPLHPEDISSLTEAPIPHIPRSKLLLRAYESVVHPVDKLEKDVLVLFLRETVLCMRIAGMRKLPREKRLSYATEGMTPILDWLEDEVEAFAEELISAR